MDNQPTRRRVRLTDITQLRDVQIRYEVDTATVARYSERLAEGEEPPPITLVEEAPLGGLLLADGWHRVAAARQQEASDIDAVIYQGTRADALMLACEKNCHGPHSVTTGERKQALRMLLQDADIARRSNRELARLVGVAPTTVQHAREELSADEQLGPRERVVLRRGQRYTMHLPPVEPKAEPSPTPVVGPGEPDLLLDFGATAAGPSDAEEAATWQGEVDAGVWEPRAEPPPPAGVIVGYLSSSIPAQSVVVQWQGPSGRVESRPVMELGAMPGDVIDVLRHALASYTASIRRKR